MANRTDSQSSIDRAHVSAGVSPSLRLVHLLALLSSAILILALCWFKIANLDLGYHLAYGNHLLETGDIVGFEPDPFLRGETAIPFVNLNWGSQFIFALVERVGGVAGLFTLRLLLVGMALSAGALIVWRHSRSMALVAASMLLVAMTAYERFSLRPELFSYALLAWMLWRLDGGLHRRRDVVVLILMQLLLVNLHSYFLLGVALTLAFAVGRSLNRAWPTPGEATPKQNTASMVKLYWLAMMLQIAICFVHPWHVHAVALPFQTVRYLSETGAMGATGDTARSSWAAISEFQSPFSFWGESINAVTISAYLLLLVLAGVACVLMLLRRQWARALVTVGIALVSFQMRRNIAPFAFLVGPLAVLALAQLATTWTVRRKALANRMLSILTVTTALALLVSVASGGLYYFERRTTRKWGTGYSDLTFSAAAVGWLRAHSTVRPELYVDYFASSNALIDLPKQYSLFVDTNTFAYSDATLRQTQEIEQGRADANAFFDQHDVNVVLLRAGSNTQVLIRNMMRDRTNWALAYVDRAHVIFLRRGVQAHAEILVNEKAPTLDAAWARRQIAETTGPDYERALTLTTIANVPLSLGVDRAALPLIEEALRLVPGYAEAWRFTGVVHGNLGNAAARERDYDGAAKHWRLAIDAFERAVVLDPSDDDAATYLSNTRSMLRMLDAASQGQ